MENAMNKNYVAEYTKAENHDFASFFTGYNNTSEMDTVKAEIAKLQKQLEDKTIQYSVLLGQRYNMSYTPVDKDIVLVYEDKHYNRYFFNGVNGSIYDGDVTDCILVNLERKNGDFAVVTGYCYNLGAIVVRQFSYSIPASNAKIAIKMKYEFLMPIVNNANGRCFYLDNDSKVKEAYVETWGFASSATHALEKVNASNFIQRFYGVNEDFNFNLLDVYRYTRKNKSFEIIIKTCMDKELRETLLGRKYDKALPIYKLIGCSKTDMDYAIEHNCLVQFANFKMETVREYMTEILKKTDKEWIDIIDNIMHLAKDLDFYSIHYPHDLVGELVTAYCGKHYAYSYTNFSLYYTFGKFVSYIVEGCINQGYTILRDFIRLLSDYFKMCEDAGVKPTLYSSYLSQTHDIFNRNHKLSVSPEQEEVFVSRYAEFEPWADKTYTVIAPVNSDDVKREGDELNHCVASYIKRIIDGECLVYFLRLADKPDESLMTFEVRENSITHVGGIHNRGLNASEYEALRKFAAQRKMKLRV